MSVFDGVEVASFDLFDTLIRIEVERLPSVEWGGTSVHTTIPVVHERLLAARGVALEDLLVAIRAMWQEVQAELTRDDGPEDVRLREVPAVEKYRRVLGRLEAIRDAEVDELAEAVADVHHAALISAAVAVPAAAKLLARVRERGIATVLVSNWDHARAGDAMLSATGLAHLLDHVVISEAVGLRKPHRKLFEAALAPFGASPRSALHVGDLAEADAWGAGRLGFATVWIDRNRAGWPEGLEPRPSLTVERLGDLLALV